MKKLIIILIIILNISCVQQMRDVTIQFKVDMTEVENVNTVGVIGEYLPMTWDVPIDLSDEDADGIYAGIITIQAAYNYAEFKFILNNEIIELKGKGNRTVRFPDGSAATYKGTFDISDR